MGAAHARALVADGATVVLADILDQPGTALADELGDAARYVHLDVTDPDQWRDAVSATVSDWGSVDVLVNNAGIVNGALLQDFALSEWQKIMDINVTGTFLGMQAVTRTMIDQKSGSIVNVSSVEGLRGSAGVHGYVASKFAVRGLTKSVAMELAQHGIRVNSIHPGIVRTPLTENIPDDLLPVPLGRVARADEVSSFVCFLASDESSYATGAEFVVDGGLTSGVPHRGM